MKQLTNYSILLLSIFSFLACINKVEKNPEKDLLNPAFKEQANNEGLVEYYDTISNVYSNYKYNIAINKPKNWKFDKGPEKYMIFRSFERDSGYNYSVSVTETKYNVENIFWEEYEKNKIIFEKELTEILEKKINSKMELEYSKITYLKNFKCLKHKYNYEMRDEDFTVDMTCIMFQIPKRNYTYTISLTLPKMFYDERQDFYENILKGVHWLSNKDDNNKAILKLK